MDYKLKNRDGVETTYTKEKLKIPAATGDSMVVFTQGEAQAEKAVDINANGAFTVEPDTGFAFVKKVSGTVNVPGVDFSQVTATPNNVLNTKRFFDNSGNLVYGTMLPGANCPANYSLGDENLTIDIRTGSEKHGIKVSTNQKIPVPGWKIVNSDVVVAPSIGTDIGLVFAAIVNNVMSTATLAGDKYADWGLVYWPMWLRVRNGQKDPDFWLYGGLSYTAASGDTAAQCQFSGSGQYRDAGGNLHTVSCGWAAPASTDSPPTLTDKTKWEKPIIDGVESSGHLLQCDMVRTFIFEEFSNKMIKIGIVR